MHNPIHAQWFSDALLYHIYPLGMLGCERSNDDAPIRHRLIELVKLIPHFKEIGVNAVYVGPLFESSTHGYDTIDYCTIDRRLGDNADFTHLVEALHAGNIRVIIDAVFNHVGRDFWAFKEVLELRAMAKTRHWFQGLRFDKRKRDGVIYDTWSGCRELVKLNLNLPKVQSYLLDAVQYWITQFHVDGLRLDAADCMPPDFFQTLRSFCSKLNPDFLLVGEVVYGDTCTYANDAMMHGATNYALYNAICASCQHNSYEAIAHALNEQFGQDGIYRNLQMYNFVDNHDVDRIASKLKSPLALYPLYALLFLIPGTPSIYYASEWGILGHKGHGFEADYPLRPAISVDALSCGHIDQTVEASALEHSIAQLAHFRHAHPALRHGKYRPIQVLKQTIIFERTTPRETLICIVSDEEKPQTLTIPGITGKWRDILNGEETLDATDGSLCVDSIPHWARVFQRQN